MNERKVSRRAGRMSQRQAVLALLRSGRTITSIEAFDNFQCTRLSAIIYDLRNMGWEIQSYTEMNPHTGTKYARYFIPSGRGGVSA